MNNTELTYTTNGYKLTTIGRENPELEFYVYELWIEGDTEPFYVGKGKDKRVFNHFADACNTDDNAHKLNKIRKSVRNNKKILHKIIYETNCELEAFSLEVTAIYHYGRLDLKKGCLTNLDYGGLGSSGTQVTEETKRKISDGQVKIKVAQISFEGKVLLIHNSVTEAAKSVNSLTGNISNCCMQFADVNWIHTDGTHRYSNNGYFWCKLEHLCETISIGDMVDVSHMKTYCNDSKKIPIIRLSLDNKILEIYESITCIKKSNNKFIPSKISECCTQYTNVSWTNCDGKHRWTHAGFKWAKVKDFPKELLDEYIETQTKICNQ